MIKQILQGWSNVALESLGMLDKETQEMATNRMLECSKCPLKAKNEFCSGKRSIKENGKEIKGCGCYIPAASTVKEHECPRGLWK